MNKNSPAESSTAEASAPEGAASAPKKETREALLPGNREIITDFYISKKVENEPEDYAFKIYIRLNAKKKIIKKVSFQHCVLDACYFNNCTFDSCDFTGCRFIDCNFHQSAFFGCTFDYAVFDNCDIDDDILEREAPRKENLKMRFARSLRINFQQVGNAKAVNRAISRELEATSSYLKKSWSSSETYYREKYRGWKKVPQFLKWLEFRLLDIIWGNGESTLKLVRTILVIHLLIAVYDTIIFGDAWDIRDYLFSLAASPGIFFGVTTPDTYPIWFLSLISATRLIGLAFLTAILVKRFGRR